MADCDDHLRPTYPPTDWTIGDFVFVLAGWKTMRTGPGRVHGGKWPGSYEGQADLADAGFKTGI